MPLSRLEHLRHMLDEADYLIAQNPFLHIPDHMADRRRGMAGISMNQIGPVFRMYF